MRLILAMLALLGISGCVSAPVDTEWCLTEREKDLNWMYSRLGRDTVIVCGRKPEDKTRRPYEPRRQAR